MTTPSKRRRQARAWMTTERERSAKVSEERAARARQSERDEWRRKVELIIPPDDDRDVFYPQGRPERVFLQVHAPQHRPPYRFDPASADARHYMHETLDVVNVRAVQMAHRLPNGRTIMWWTWEVGR